MTQQENLNEFVNRRMAELGLGYKDISNAGIGAQTMVNIRNGVPFQMRDVTKEKFAKLLKCSIGDINAALSVTGQLTPFNEEVTKEKPQPSVMETVDRLDQLVKEQYPEEPENMPGMPEPAADKTKPKTKKIVATDITAPKKVKILKRAIKPEEEPAMTVEEYKRELKDICLQLLSEEDPFDTDSVALFAVIGRKLLRKLVEA